MTKQVMIIAGEASGDLHAANLVRSLNAERAGVRFFGIGGPRMREAGVETLVDSRVMAVVGIVEILAQWRTIFGALKQMRQLLAARKPDLLILVDYPEFNLKLARTAKELRVPVLFYISPQVWAWRQHRVHKIGRLVDMMAVVFPFEVPFYERAGIPVRFVGHPLADEVGSDLTRDQALTEFGLDPARPALGLFPGSRRSELKRLLPVLLDSAEQLHRERPAIQFLLPLASSLDESDLGPYLEGRELPVTVVPNRPYDVMRACDAAIAASGTVTLEIALIGVPLAVIYRVKPLSYRIMRRLIKIPHIALCNIVADQRIAREMIQDEATAEAIAGEALRLIEDADYAGGIRNRLEIVRERLGAGGGSRKVAALALEMLEGGASADDAAA